MAAMPSARRTRVSERELARAAAFRTELRRFLRRTDAVAAGAGLTPQRYDLLLMIRTAGGANGVRVTELCDLLQMQQTAVTELVKRTEEAGLIDRRVAPDDRRASLLRLTAEGERRLMLAFVALRGDRGTLAMALDELDLRLESAGS
jgi:DNA-binding MarR family transcriptional regulator